MCKVGRLKQTEGPLASLLSFFQCPRGLWEPLWLWFWLLLPAWDSAFSRSASTRARSPRKSAREREGGVARRRIRTERTETRRRWVHRKTWESAPECQNLHFHLSKKFVWEAPPDSLPIYALLPPQCSWHHWSHLSIAHWSFVGASQLYECVGDYQDFKFKSLWFYRKYSFGT